MKFIYKNSRINKYSVKDEESGLVVDYVEHCLLVDAAFKVSESGRLRVLERRVKNVHAGVKGTILLNEDKAEKFFNSCKEIFNKQAYYNPYKTTTFISVGDNKAIYSAKLVYLSPYGVFYYGGVHE